MCVSDEGQRKCKEESLEVETATTGDFAASIIAFLFFFSFWTTSALATTILLSKASNARFLESAAMNCTFMQYEQGTEWISDGKDQNIVAAHKTTGGITITSLISSSQTSKCRSNA